MLTCIFDYLFVDKKPHLFKTDTSRHISQPLNSSNSSSSDIKPSSLSSDSLKIPTSSLLSSISGASSEHGTSRTVKSEPSLTSMPSSLYSSYYHRLALHGTGGSNEGSSQDINSSPSGSASSTFPGSELPALTPAPFSMPSANASSTHSGGNVGSLLHSGLSHGESFNQTPSHHLSGSSSTTSPHGQNANHGNMQASFAADDFKYPNHLSSSASTSSGSQSHHSHYPHSSAAMAAVASAHHGYLTNTANGSGMFPYTGLTDHSHHHYAKLNMQAS